MSHFIFCAYRMHCKRIFVSYDDDYDDSEAPTMMFMIIMVAYIRAHKIQANLNLLRPNKYVHIEAWLSCMFCYAHM